MCCLQKLAVFVISERLTLMKIKEMKRSQSCEESLHKHRGRTHYAAEGMQLLQPSLMQGRPCVDLQSIAHTRHATDSIYRVSLLRRISSYLPPAHNQ
jgi:hypothetical protein